MAARIAVSALGVLVSMCLSAGVVQAQGEVPEEADGGSHAAGEDDDDDDDDGGEAEDKEHAAAKKKEKAGPYSDIFAEDWFDLASPGIELGGYYRVRTQLYHNFSLGRRDPLAFDPLVDSGYPAIWPKAPDYNYVDTSGGEHGVSLCNDDPTKSGACRGKVQAGANMRFRFEPSIFVGDNVSVHAQIDMLDNIVLGSTPQGYANQPSVDGGYEVVARGGYAPIGSFASTTWAPVGGSTTEKDAVMVKRVWGEYRSPIGTIAFGRMPHHWGLGMVHNAGSDVDADFGDSVDRIMFSTGFPKYHLYISGAWDFMNEGATGSPFHSEQGNTDTAFPADAFSTEGQSYDLSRKDDLDHWVIMIMYKTEEQLARRMLALGDPVVNTGVYFSYEQQELANDTTSESGASLANKPTAQTEGLVRRGYEAVLGDLWLQMRYRKFRVELEAALLYGTLQNTLSSEDDFDNQRDSASDGWTVQQFGIASEMDYRALADRLRLGFGFGFASGDDDVVSLQPTSSASAASSLERQLTLDRTYSTFRFHPNYKVDQILFRSLLTRVEGAYYFRPSLEYDFFSDGCLKSASGGPCPGEAGIDPFGAGGGQRAGAGLAVIWSRASEPVQAPGHEPDLGVELNVKIYYQLSPGPVSSDIQEMGGFYTSLEYGVLFPLPGLDYLPGQISAYSASNDGAELSVTPANTLRWILGVMY